MAITSDTTSRRAFLASLGAAALAQGCGPRLEAAAEAAPRPNIVMVLSDDHTITDTGCYGSKAVKTPHIDRLAREGMLFRNAFAATAMCVPSRATLYSGLYPMRHGAWPNHSRVHDGIRSLPHYLKPLGYRVAVAGKTHFRPRECFPFEILCPAGEVTDLRLSAVDKFLGGLDGKPCCLFVCTSDPHVPWPEEGEYDPKQVGLPPYLIDTPSTRKWMARYYSEVSRADRLVGAVDTLLKKHKLADNTLFIYSSDQGGQWPYAKWNLYDASINVPFVARWPGTLRPGSTSDALVGFVDVAPTWIELAGGKPPRGLDGKSFASLLLGRTAEHRDAIFATSSCDGTMNQYPIRAIRTRTHKYILNLAPDREHDSHITKSPNLNAAGLEYMPEWREAAKRDPQAARVLGGYLRRPAEELYDIRSDPFERKNLAGDPEHRALLESLRARVKAWMKQQGDKGMETEAKAHERRGKPRPRKPSKGGGGPAPPAREWRYTVKNPGKGWEVAEYDDSAWEQGKSGFGRIRLAHVQVNTRWATSDIWLRRAFELKAMPRRATLRIFHDEDAEVYLNGQRIAAFTGHVARYIDRPLDAALRQAQGGLSLSKPAALKLLRPGRNVLAVHCRHTAGGQYIDADILTE